VPAIGASQLCKSRSRSLRQGVHHFFPISENFRGRSRRARRLANKYGPYAVHTRSECADLHSTDPPSDPLQHPVSSVVWCRPRAPRSRPLRRVWTAWQYQGDLPVVRPIVRAFTIEIGRCRTCGRRVQGRDPLQTSDALGAAAAQLGPQTVTLAAVLHAKCGVPLTKVSARW
jgi:hypothetical protein